MSDPMKFVYVASVYSHPDPGTMYRRSAEALEFVARYYKANPDPKYFLYSPIAYMAQAERNYGLPGDFQFWQKLDEAAIDRFDEMWILMLPGIEKSKGVRSEVTYAQSLGKPITLIEPYHSAFDDGVVDYEFRYMTESDAKEFGWTWKDE